MLNYLFPALILDSANDTELQLMIQRLGLRVMHALATMEHGIPSLWVIAKNTREHGMNVVCAGGSHLDPVRALKCHSRNSRHVTHNRR